MIPSRTLFNRMVDLFMANTTLLAVADPNQVRVQVVNQAFVPGLDKVLADVPAQGAPLLASALLVATDAAPIVWSDPLTQERVGKLAFADANGTFRGTTGTYPFTAFGTRLVSADGATLLATKTLPANVPFGASNDGFEAPPLEFRFPTSMVR